jgi:hypothetical protein
MDHNWERGHSDEAAAVAGPQQTLTMIAIVELLPWWQQPDQVPQPLSSMVRLTAVFALF